MKTFIQCLAFTLALSTLAIASLVILSLASFAACKHRPAIKQFIQSVAK